MISSEVRVAEIIATIRNGLVAFDANVFAAKVATREIIFLLLKFTSSSSQKFLAQLETQNRSNIRVIEFPAGFLPS